MRFCRENRLVLKKKGRVFSRKVVKKHGELHHFVHKLRTKKACSREVCVRAIVRGD